MPSEPKKLSLQLFSITRSDQMNTHKNVPVAPTARELITRAEPVRRHEHEHLGELNHIDFRQLDVTIVVSRLLDRPRASSPSHNGCAATVSEAKPR